MRFLIPLLVLAVLVFTMVWVARSLAARAAYDRRLYALVEQVRDLAWDHEPLDPQLCGAVLDRLALYDRNPTPTSARQVLDDVLGIARKHRETSPDLATILIDTIRKPKELG